MRHLFDILELVHGLAFCYVCFPAKCLCFLKMPHYHLLPRWISKCSCASWLYLHS